MKMVRFKKISDSVDNKIVIPIKGQSQFTAGDISNFTSSFEILNPELVICTLDEKADLEIEVTVEKGRGAPQKERGEIKRKNWEVIPQEDQGEETNCGAKTISGSPENIRTGQSTVQS